jgi:hypothetical protein
MLIKQSTAVAPLLFLMVDSSDHITGKTGLSPTVTISKAGGAFATPAGAVTELSGGWYKIAANATDSNTLGQIVIHATASGADPCDDKSYEVEVVGLGDLVRSTTPANTLSVNNVGAIISVVDVTGSITGNLGGKVLGGGDSDITGVGAWVLDGTGQAIAGQVSKTGYKLAADGLDSITVTAPTTVATSFPSMVVQLWRRFFRKATETSTQLKTYADDGSTVVTTQTIANDGTTQTQGTAS